MTRRTSSPAAWAAIVAGHLAVTSLIWHSVAYLLFGRKRAGAPGPT